MREERPVPQWLSAVAATPTIVVAFGISLLLHAAALSIHFTFPDRLAQRREQALDVILVNAKSRQAPKDPQAKAQANLDGGGAVAEKRRAKTPLPASSRDSPGADVAAAERRVAELEQRQRELLHALASEQAGVSAKEAQATHDDRPRGRDLAAQALALARLQGEIAREIDAYNQRPRRKFIGARAVEYRFAQYVEDWRQKVERIGNLNYPEAARGKLYGSLVLTVKIKSDGSLEGVELNRSSGHKLLDEAAQRIVHLAAPYAPFPEAIRHDTDIIEITRTWNFVQGDRLQSN